MSKTTSSAANKESKTMPKDEVERQTVRKKMMKSSRFLDNYYNPRIHQNHWKSNGVYIIKKNYVYGSETGLSHYYENHNVLEKKPKSVEKVLKIKPKHFIEYDYIEENEIVITIEHW